MTWLILAVVVLSATTVISASLAVVFYLRDAASQAALERCLDRADRVRPGRTKT